MQSVPYWRLSALYFFYFSAVGVISPYWSVYLDGLGFSGPEIGLLLAVPMLTRIVAPNLWGWLADRTGQYLRVIQVGALAAIVAFIGLFFNQDFWGIVLFSGVYTFFWNAILPQFEVITLDSLGDNTNFYSRIRLWGSIGFIAAVVGLGALLDVFSVHVLLYVMLGALIAIFISSLSLTLGGTAQAHERSSSTFLTDLKDSSVISFLTSALLLHLSHGAFYGFYSLYLMAHHYSSTQVGLLWSVGVIAEIVIFLKVPAIFARYTLKMCFVLALMAACIRWFLVGAFVDSGWVMVLAQVLHALTFGLAHSVAIEIVRMKFARSERGKAQAFYSAVCFGGGGALGAYLSGHFWSMDPSWCFYASVVAALSALLIALVGINRAI